MAGRVYARRRTSGMLIEAIERVREATGLGFELGFEESKDVMDRIESALRRRAVRSRGEFDQTPAVWLVRVRCGRRASFPAWFWRSLR